MARNAVVDSLRTLFVLAVMFGTVGFVIDFGLLGDAIALGLVVLGWAIWLGIRQSWNEAYVKARKQVAAARQQP